MRNLILLVLLATIFSCGVYDNKPKVVVTHVLAITQTGDTLKLPINSIRPNVYYNITTYPNRYYYNNWNQYPYYQGSYNNNRPIYVPSNNNNNNNNNNNTPVNTPTKPSKPSTSAQNAAVRKRGGN